MREIQVFNSGWVETISDNEDAIERTDGIFSSFKLHVLSVQNLDTIDALVEKPLNTGGGLIHHLSVTYNAVLGAPKVVIHTWACDINDSHDALPESNIKP